MDGDLRQWLTSQVTSAAAAFSQTWRSCAITRGGPTGTLTEDLNIKMQGPWLASVEQGPMIIALINDAYHALGAQLPELLTWPHVELLIY